jgi:hypothetical protein
MELISRGFTKADIFGLSVQQVMFLAKVNNRLKELDTMSQIQTIVAANNRQMDDLAFSSFTNKLKYG